MQGGLLSRVDETLTIEEQMSFILSNSTIKVVSHGVYGFACEVIMKPDIPSGFIDEDGTPVTTFIIKLVPLDMRMAHKDMKWSSQSTYEKFITELSLQRHVYKESLRKHYYSPCPAVIGFFNYTVGQLETLLPGEFSYGVVKDGETIKTTNDDFRVGVIFMEFSSSPQGPTLYDAVEKHTTTLAEKQGEATRLYCMALECGVNHRDAHPDNFLIDDKGRLKLIDFGLARQLTEKEKEKVLPLIPLIASDDCDELRNELQKLYKNAWFLSTPFSIDSYTTKIAKKAVKRCAEGLCEIERPEKMIETKAAEETPLWSSDLGTTEQDKKWARELEEIKMKELIKRADYLMKHNYYHQLIGKTPEELEEIRKILISNLRRQDKELEEAAEEEDASGGRRMRKTKRTRRKMKRTRRKK